MVNEHSPVFPTAAERRDAAKPRHSTSVAEHLTMMSGGRSPGVLEKTTISAPIIGHFGNTATVTPTELARAEHRSPEFVPMLIVLME